MRRFVNASILLALLSCVGCSSDGTSAPAVETILFNGKILTVDAAFSSHEAIALGGGKVVAVGSNADIRQMAGPQTQVRDLRGRTVIPGLIDSHIHDAGGGLGVDLSRVRSMAELLDAIAARVRQTPDGELIVTNAGWHEGQLREQRLPLRHDLDTVAPNHPVVVRRGGQQFILNSAALQRWNITTRTPVPPRGQIPRYDDGELNGELVSGALALVTLPPPQPKDLAGQIRDQVAMMQTLHQRGLTSVRIAGAPIEQYQLLQDMLRRGHLSMRVDFLLSAREFPDAAALAAAIESWGVEPDEGNEWLRIGGAKLFIDGAYEGALMTAPYAEPYGHGGTYRGIQLVQTETFTALVRELGKRGFRVAVHTLGDGALDVALGAFEAANRDASIADRRWSIEHGFMVRPDQIPRLRRLNVIMATQRQLHFAAPSMRRFWGRERAEAVNQIRTLLDSGVRVAAGTDREGELLPTFYHYVTRNTISDGVYDASQRVTREEALRLITIANAYLSREEAFKGSLEPGKAADLVVLSDDIMTIPETAIENIRVLMTMVHGRIVYQHSDLLR